MAQLPLDQAIDRFKANESRADIFINGDEDTDWVASDGAQVPSLRKFQKVINTQGAGWLALAEEEANRAADAVLASAIWLFDSIAAFNQAVLPSSIKQVDVVSPSGEIVIYRRQNGANGAQDLLHPDGSMWAKASLTQADLLAAVTDVTSAIERIPYQRGINGNVSIVPATPGTFSMVYGARRLVWERFGNTVEFMLRISGTPTLGTGVGQLRITGFPFPAAPFSCGGASLRSGFGIDLQYHGDDGPSVPTNVAGYFPDNEAHMLITIMGPTGIELTNVLGVGRLQTGRVFNLEFFGKYEIVA